MDFDEVKVVWNKIIPGIKEVIDVTELVDYLAGIFSPTCVSRINAQKAQYGCPTAANEFFEEAKRKPKAFPVILAALKKTQQSDCLIKILETVVAVFPSPRREEVFNLVRKAAENLDSPVNVEEEIQAAIQRLTPNTRGYVETEVKCVSRTGQPDYEERSPAQDENTQTTARVQAPLSNSNVQVIGPNVHPSSKPGNTELIYQRTHLGIPLGELKSIARKKISDQLAAMSPDGDNPVWSVLLDSEDLDINSKETREIEKARSPGKELFDKLDGLGYTTDGLIAMLDRQQCVDAATTVRQQSTQVARRDLSNIGENNLNLPTQPRVHQRSQVHTAGNQPTTGQGDIGSSSNPSQCVEHQDSSDDNIAHDSIDSPYMKGTQAIEAVGDRANTKSTLPAEVERGKLLRDRVGQHTGNENNLESFSDLQKTSEQNKDIPVEDPSLVTHDISGERSLDPPELVQHPGTVPGNVHPGPSNVHPEPGTSNVQSTGSHSDNTKKLNVLEHVEGSTFYDTQLESLHKLHSDTTDVASLTIDEEISPLGGSSTLPSGDGSTSPSGGFSTSPSGDASTSPPGGSNTSPPGGCSTSPSGGSSTSPSGGSSTSPSGGSNTTPSGDTIVSQPEDTSIYSVLETDSQRASDFTDIQTLTKQNKHTTDD